MVSIVLEHAVGILLHFLELLNGTVGLLERVSSHDVQVLLKEIDVFEGVSFLLGPLDFKTEDSRTFSQNISSEFGQTEGFGQFGVILVVFVADIVAAAEELLLFVGD